MGVIVYELLCVLGTKPMSSTRSTNDRQSPNYFFIPQFGKLLILTKIGPDITTCQHRNLEEKHECKTWLLLIHATISILSGSPWYLGRRQYSSKNHHHCYFHFFIYSLPPTTAIIILKRIKGNILGSVDMEIGDLKSHLKNSQSIYIHPHCQEEGALVDIIHVDRAVKLSNL